MSDTAKPNDHEAQTGMGAGQVLVVLGLVLLHGLGGYWLILEVNQDSDVPWHIKGGIPALVIGVSILFVTVLKQRLKAAKTDRYVEVSDEQESQVEMLVVSSPTVPGKRIMRTLGLASGNTIRARHGGKDILAGLRNLVGGEITEYAQLLAESREQARDRMKAKALKMGGNAVISVQSQTSVIMGALRR